MSITAAISATALSIAAEHEALQVITTEEAQRHIRSSLPSWKTESVDVLAAVGRSLHQSVSAERDQPPFDRVTMDGIAIRFDDFDAGCRSFPIAGTCHAGDRRHSMTNAGECIEVMTGAVLPDGCDTVIAVERINVANNTATLEDGYAPTSGQFVHRQGSDHQVGTVLLERGHRVAPVDVAVLASCGLASVDVAASPCIRVVSTGNELVAAGSPILPHQIRMSNGPGLVALLREAGFQDAEHLHLRDDPAELERELAVQLDAVDVLVLSGGVSMGKADFVPAVLGKLGVNVVFHKITQRPGKPMWFGKGIENQLVFALPGNPVSALVCCRQYVVPALLAGSGRPAPKEPRVRLIEDVQFVPNLTCFLPVSVSTGADAAAIARPVPTNTSGDFAALSGTDGYVELAREQTLFPADSIVPFHPWRAD